MESRRFSLLTVLLSLFGGLITLFIGEIIFSLKGSVSEYILMGFYFGVGAFVISAMILFAQAISPTLIGYRWKTQYLGTSLKLFIPSTLIMIGLSAFFLQGLYGMQIGIGKAAKDIIIAIDTSGSMNETDPNGERFDAVKALIEELKEDKKVALVTFDEEPYTVFDFTALNDSAGRQMMKENIDNIVNSKNGLTEIKKMMEYCYEVIDHRADKTRKSSLIIVSDGEPTDGSEQNIPLLTEKYRAENIPIYTVGMMHKTAKTEQYLEAIANTAGGKHFSISRVGMLKKTFEKIRYSQESRNLLGERNGYIKESLFYGGMRILFLSVIGGLIALGLGFIFDNRFLAKGFIIGGVTGAFLGSICLEVFMRNSINMTLGRAVFLLIFTLFLPLFTWSVEFKDSYHGTRKV